MMENKATKVLDHGLVRLVNHMGGDLDIVRSARVSYDAEWRAGEDKDSDHKLINFLMKNKHTTPFEAVQFTFEVKAPIFVFRQWHRHRTQSYNGVSARYTELPEEFYIPEPHLIGIQNQHNKQMRDVKTPLEFEKSSTADHTFAQTTRMRIRNQNASAFEEYQSMLKHGVPRELARSVLPVGTYSHMFCSMNLHNLFHFLRLRLHPHAQYEIRVYAEAMLEQIREKCPVAVAAFEETLEK